MLALLAAIVAVGCSASPPRITVEETRQLGALDEHRPAALAIDPETETIDVVYERWDRIALVTLPRTGSPSSSPRWTGRAPSGVLVALGGGVHAVLGPEGGFRLDERTDLAEPFFCLVPGAEDMRWPPELAQRSRALAHDASRRLLWTQPRTFRDGEAVQSQIASFDSETGEDLGWWDLEDPRFEASAMAVLPDGTLLLADWHGLHVFDPSTGALVEIATLRDLGLVTIAAMAWDPRTERVLAIERPFDWLVTLDVSR